MMFLILGGLGMATIWAQRRTIEHLRARLIELRSDFCEMHRACMEMKREIEKDRGVLQNIRATSLRVSLN